MSQRLAGIVLILCFLLLVACTTAPRGPAKGSPEWLYQAAQETFRLGEYEKTHQHLDKIEHAGANPYLARASAWHLAMETGLVLGNQELIEAYDKGSFRAGPRKSSFLSEKNDLLKEARRHALHLVDVYDHFVQAEADKPVTLEFPFPKGSGAPVADLERVYKSMWPMDELRAQIHEKVVSRGMVRGVSATITGIDDSAGAQAALKSGRTEIPAAKFLLAIGQSLWKSRVIFDLKNLREPDKMKHFHERALDAAKRARQLKPETSVETAAKKLQEDCEKELKIKKT